MGGKNTGIVNGTIYAQLCREEWTPVSAYDKIREELLTTPDFSFTAPLLDYTEFWRTKTVPREYKIDKVIFNGPATIVFWCDGSKTVVKCGSNDVFDKEKGIAMCFVKKIYGNKGCYNNVFKPWIGEEE